ncbi:MAG: hypothetical protein ACT4OJ_14885 [Bacteroidota bacterium]
MKLILSERNIVVILFIMVLITFSLAQEDSKKKLTGIYTATTIEPGSRFLGLVISEQPAEVKEAFTPRQ